MALVAMIFVQDGSGGVGRRIQVISIDPGTNREFVMQEQVARTGVLFGGSFEIKDPTWISPVWMERSRWAFLSDNAGRRNLAVARGEPK